MPIEAKPIPFSAKQVAFDDAHRKARGRPWGLRPVGTGLKWFKHYDTPEQMTKGRVLVIDYVKKGTRDLKRNGDDAG